MAGTSLSSSLRSGGSSVAGGRGVLGGGLGGVDVDVKADDITCMPASAPAFSSLSLDADDMDTARMRRAKYWLQK